MDPLCWKIIAGMATGYLGLGWYILRLDRDYKRCQEERVREANENKGMLRGIYDLIRGRKNGP